MPRIHSKRGGGRGPPNDEEMAGQGEDNLYGWAQVRHWKSAGSGRRSVDPEWTGARGVTYRPGGRPAGWTGRWCHFGDNKEVYAVIRHSAFSTPAARANTSYTVVDSTAALRRAQTDRTGPGQAFAASSKSPRLRARRCSVTLRWTPFIGE